MYSVHDNQLLGWVSPFGNPRIKVCCRLPEAYRRLTRPSSPSAAKASAGCAYSLDHITQPAMFSHAGPNDRTKVAGNFTCDGTYRHRHASNRAVTLVARRRTIFYFIFGLSIATRQGRTIGVAPPKSDTWLHQKRTVNERLPSRGRTPTQRANIQAAHALFAWMLAFVTSLTRAIGGAEEDRTPDLLCARQVLSQLSYGPFSKRNVQRGMPGELAGRALRCRRLMRLGTAHAYNDALVSPAFGGSGRI